MHNSVKNGNSYGILNEERMFLWCKSIMSVFLYWLLELLGLPDPLEKHWLDNWGFWEDNKEMQMARHGRHFHDLFVIATEATETKSSF